MRWKEINEVLKLRGFGSVPVDLNSPSTKFIRAVEAECPTNPLNDRALVFNNKAVFVLRRNRVSDSTVELQDIRAMQRGGGAECMKYLCGLADSFGVTLELYAYGYDNVPTSQLVKYYTKFGFSIERRGMNNEDGVDMKRSPSSSNIITENTALARYYHVTDRDYVENIMQYGFYGGWGDVGFGVYLYGNIHDAVALAHKKGWDGQLVDPVILEVQSNDVEKIVPQPGWNTEEYRDMYWYDMSDDEDARWCPRVTPIEV